MLRTAVAEILDFCFPSRCAACDAAFDGSHFLCVECSSTLQDIENAPACEKCAMPLAQEGTPCPYCRGNGATPFDRIVRLGAFEDPLKRMIHEIKYEKRWPLAEQLADRLAARADVRRLLDASDCLLPMPLHPRRQVERGYNQAAVIARRLSKSSGLPIVNPVIRLRNTETQTHVHSRAKRAENLRDAFSIVDAKKIVGNRVAVVDDVMTTGATLAALGRTLKHAAPASINAILLAIADPRGRGFEMI